VLRISRELFNAIHRPAQFLKRETVAIVVDITQPEVNPLLDQIGTVSFQRRQVVDRSGVGVALAIFGLYYVNYCWLVWFSFE